MSVSCCSSLSLRNLSTSASQPEPGVAKASNSFTRTLGQTVGIGVLGTVFNNSLSSYVQSHLPGGWQGGDISNALMSGANVGIPSGILDQLRAAMAHSLHLVFILVLALSLATLLISTFLPAHKKTADRPQTD